jgi:hypothetical protein
MDILSGFSNMENSLYFLDNKSNNVMERKAFVNEHISNFWYENNYNEFCLYVENEIMNINMFNSVFYGFHSDISFENEELKTNIEIYWTYFLKNAFIFFKTFYASFFRQKNVFDRTFFVFVQSSCLFLFSGFF